MALVPSDGTARWILQFPADLEQECSWVCSWVFSPSQRVWLQPGETQHGRDFVLSDGQRKLIIKNCFLAEGTALSAARLPPSRLPNWNPSASGLRATLTAPTIPVLFGTPQFHVDEEGHGHLGLDVIGSAFFMLSRYEELVVSERDEHDRFPARASIAFREGFLQRPIVDEYVEILWAAIEKLWPDFERAPRRFATRVTHDVDAPARDAFRSWTGLIRAAAGDILRRRALGKPLRRIRIRAASRRCIHPADEYNTFDWIMESSEKLGLRSAFYFICGRTHPRYDAQYEIGYPSIRKLLRTIYDRGHEIGLHPSYGTYKSPASIFAEATALKRTCSEEGIEQAEWGGRMHFLRWEMPTTLRAWDQAGMSYDSTLGYADLPGFRCGTCREFPAFDAEERRRLELVIRPLVAMECTVIADRYMGLGLSAAACEKFLELKNACRIMGGTFTLLWHNTLLVTPQERELYQAVLTG